MIDIRLSANVALYDESFFLHPPMRALAYSLANSPFNAAKVPLATARSIQGEVDDWREPEEDIESDIEVSKEERLVSRKLDKSVRFTEEMNEVRCQDGR